MCGQRSPLSSGCTLGLFEQKNARRLAERPHENAPCEFSADLVIFQRRFTPKNTPIRARMQRCAGHQPALLIFQLGFGFWSHFAPSDRCRTGRVWMPRMPFYLFLSYGSRSPTPTRRRLCDALTSPSGVPGV